LRFGIDGSGLFPRYGINEITIQLVRHLVEVDAGNKYFLYTLEDLPSELELDSSSLVVRRADHWNRKVWQQTRLPLAARRDNVDLMLFPSNSVSSFVHCRSAAIIHDLHAFVCPEPYARVHTSEFHGGWLRATFNRWYWKQMLRVAARQDKVLVYSESTERDLKDLFNTPAERIERIRLGVDHEVFNCSVDSQRQIAVQQQLGLPERYLLCVGTHTFKNLEGSIRAFDLVKRRYSESLGLVVAGHASAISTRIVELLRERELEDEVVFAGFVSRDDLKHVYQLAELLLFPSFYEGFGLPVIEALACGTPVVTSTTGSLPEAAGEAGLLVDPYDPEDIAAAVLRLLNDPELRRERRRRGLDWATRFSWRETGRRVMEVLERTVLA